MDVAIDIDAQSDRSYRTDEETVNSHDWRVYCINLKSRNDRYNKMLTRFENRGLADKVTFVQAIDKHSDLLRYYTNESRGLDIDNSDFNYGEIACFASHLKALRLFLENTEDNNEFAVICEDDILLHNNFSEELNDLIMELPFDFNICALSYFPINKNEYTKITEGLYQMGQDNIWGTQMYLISREYALDCLFYYDRPEFGHIPEPQKSDREAGNESDQESERITSELILRKSNGHLVKKMLAIEECEDSDIREVDEGFPQHSLAFCKMDYEDYSDGEKELAESLGVHESILKSMVEYRINKLIKYRQTDRALNMAEKMLNSIDKFKINISEYDYSRIIDEYFINLYYLDAAECGVKIERYINLMRTDNFKKMFEENPDQLDHINSNLDFVGMKI